MPADNDSSRSYLDAFVLSAQDALRTMAGMDCTCEECRECKNPDTADQLCAFMKIHGERTGCIGVAISHALATEMIACILGLRTEDLEADEVPGGICEVLNVITGNAKARLKGTPFHFEISPPELDTDKFMQCLSPCTLVHLKTGEEHFDLLIALENA